MLTRISDRSAVTLKTLDGGSIMRTKTVRIQSQTEKGRNKHEEKMSHHHNSTTFQITLQQL